MDEQKPDMDRVLDLYREASTPSGASKERVWDALEADLAVPPPGGEGGGGAAPAGASGTGAGKLVLLGGVVVLAGAFMLWRGAQDVPEPESAAVTESEPAAESVTETVTVTAPESVTAPASETETAVPTTIEAAKTEAPAPRPARGTLAEEMKLMTAAQRAARAGDPARALASLRKHRARFPRGVMAEEREAERVLALCALGRDRQARAARARFLERFAGSPLAPRVRRACGDGE